MVALQCFVANFSPETKES